MDRRRFILRTIRVSSVFGLLHGLSCARGGPSESAPGAEKKTGPEKNSTPNEPTPSATPTEVKIDSISRIAFGSCALQYREQPIWDVIAGTSPDVFAFIGDNVYGDTRNADWLAKQYERLGEIPEFKRFRKRFPMIVTWDDHDFGENDSGAEFPMKAESKKQMLKFFGEPQSSERWSRDGVYTSYYYGSHPHRVQFIVLDLRWWRSRPNPRPANKDEYEKTTILGPEQWRWLEKELQVPADFRILVSSSQVISTEHGMETWGDYPRDRKQLISLIDRFNLKNLVIISGDMHFGELSMERTPQGIPLYDLTSSGLNQWLPGKNLPNKRRLAVFDDDANFGLVTIDWRAQPVRAQLEVRDAKGRSVIQREFRAEP